MLSKDFIDNETILFQTILSIEMCTKRRLQVIDTRAALQSDRLTPKDQLQQREIRCGRLKKFNVLGQEQFSEKKMLVYFVGNRPIR